MRAALVVLLVTLGLLLSPGGAHADPGDHVVVSETVTLEHRHTAVPLQLMAGRHTLAATASPTPEPPWSLLYAFGFAATAAFLLVVLVYIRWWHTCRRAAGSGVSSRCGLGTPLPRLTGKWTFTGSVANNLTVVAAAFTGLAGASDVLAETIGEVATPVLGVGTVAAAVAVGLLGAGPLVLQASRAGPRADVTVFGLLAAGMLTLAAVGGQLGVLVWAAAQLPMGGFERVTPLIGASAAGLLVVYGARSLLQNLRMGAIQPPIVDSTRTPTGLPVAAEKISELVRSGRVGLHDLEATLFPSEAGTGRRSGPSLIATTSGLPELREAATEIRQALQRNEMTVRGAHAHLFPRLRRRYVPDRDRRSALI